MAAFEIRATLKVIQSHIAASGYAPLNQIGEPKGALATRDRLGASVHLGTGIVNRAALGGGTEERHIVIVRFYMNALAEPQEDIEFLLSEGVSKVSEALIGDFTLGSTVRNIAIAGEAGQALAYESGYLDISGTMYRIVDLTVPMIVDNAVTQAP